MHEEVFQNEVLPEIIACWDQFEPMAIQVQNHWYGVMEDMTAKDALKAWDEFYRTAATKRNFPRPAQFADWRPKNGYHIRKPHAATGLTFTPLAYPAATMVRVTYSNGDELRGSTCFGWIDRRPNSEMMLNLWARTMNKFWNIRVAPERRFHEFQITEIGEAPKSWGVVNTPYFVKDKSGAPAYPEGLEELLERDQGRVNQEIPF